MLRFRPVGILCLSLVLFGAGCTSVQNEESLQTKEVVQISPNTNIKQSSMEKRNSPIVLSDSELQNKQVRIKTEKGDIVIALYPETAPLTVSNFITLIKDGYYDGLTFHRREEGFVIQGGDPNGNGTGGPGYKFADELKDDYSYARGIVAMANSGPNTNGSQFFIMLDDVPLPKLYSIFGTVTEGIEIVDQIKIGDKMTQVTIEDKK